MGHQSRNPGYLFWLHTLIGVPFGAFAIVWVAGFWMESGAALLGCFGLLLVGAAAVVWRAAAAAATSRAWTELFRRRRGSESGNCGPSYHL
jgi:hypothetical protein